MDVTWVVVEVCFEFRFGSSLSRFRHGDGSLFSHALASQFDAIGIVHEAIEDVLYEGLQASGGSFSAEHGVGLDKRDAYERHADPVKQALARAIKGMIDPANVMNPGKIIAGE
ncbi:MAG: hypothetical protein E5W30_03250 [Mesorhizobium sp.]|nr:MAG: hypothetical protein E5W30_03250 [Mesorhizobium sp.]